MMTRLMNFFLLSCKKSTELIEKKNIQRLRIIEHAQLMMHTSMCDACKAYEKQSVLLDIAIFRYIKSEEKPSLILPDEIKVKIVSKIQQR